MGWISISGVIHPFDNLAFLDFQVARLKDVFLQNDTCIHLCHLGIVNVSILLPHHVRALKYCWHLLVVNDSVLFAKITFVTRLLPAVAAFLHCCCSLLGTSRRSVGKKVGWLPILELCLASILLYLVHKSRFDGRVRPVLFFVTLELLWVKFIVALIPTFSNLLELNLLAFFAPFNTFFGACIEPQKVREFGFWHRFTLHVFPSVLLKVINWFQKSLRRLWLCLLGIIWLLRILRIEPKTIIHICKSKKI